MMRFGFAASSKGQLWRYGLHAFLLTGLSKADIVWQIAAISAGGYGALHATDSLGSFSMMWRFDIASSTWGAALLSFAMHSVVVASFAGPG